MPESTAAVVPFDSRAAEAELQDLRARLTATRFPEPETVN